MSDYLVIADEKRRSFEAGDVVQILEEIDGITKVRFGNDGAGNKSVEGDWKHNGQSATVNFVEGENSSVRVSDCGECGLALAVEFGQRYAIKRGYPLRVFNAVYTFDQRVDETSDLESLKQKIVENPFAASR